ncbi:MAG: hypothetical protein A3B17_02210 [Candidatus Yanofskybacteria bacterium RIFCSPLOWO2_01_FULL_45_72]|nr:MAG: hypothetical protein A3B17_02210 [Candidatus Yanofskybacteria bacterium RIFCSPLOWO2_01_FULL_45_72]
MFVFAKMSIFVKSSKSFWIFSGILTAAAMALFLYLIAPPYGAPANAEVEIESGSGLYQIAGELRDDRIIRSKTLFIAYIVLIGRKNDLKAGRYLIDRYWMPRVVAVLSKGVSALNDIVVTVPEGFNVWEIDKKLAERELIREGDFARKYYKKEGYLFPDTYRVSQPSSRAQVEGKSTFVPSSGRGKVNLRPELRSRESQPSSRAQVEGKSKAYGGVGGENGGEF